MKINPFKFILFSACIVFFTSCLGTTDTTTVTSDAAFYSLSFASDDSVSGIEDTEFDVFQYGTNLKDSAIRNVDSIAFGSDINDVMATFTFNSTAGMYLISESEKDSVGITSTDTIDFTKSWYIKNYASDGLSYLKYKLDITAHQVEPELYNWIKLSDIPDAQSTTSQKLVAFQSQLFYYSNDGTNSYLYTSTDGQAWASATVTGLPVNKPLGDITEYNGKLYMTRDVSNIYSSADGKTWNQVVSNYEFKSLLFVFQDKLWAVAKSPTDTLCRFATFTEASGWVIRGEIPASFPVRDFAAISFASRTNVPKVLVLGGYSASDDRLLNRWSSEDGVNWVDFSLYNHTLDTLAAGASIVSYDSKILLFGVRSDASSYVSHFRQSIDEGLSWQAPDTLYNRLRQPIYTTTSTGVDTTYINMKPAIYQSAVVLNPANYKGKNTASLLSNIQKSNRIFIVGGKTQTGVLSDAWTSKVNRLNFLRQ